jgi:hypothetical protein
MYHMIECFGPEDQERQAIDTVPTGFSWNSGVPFTKTPNAPLTVIMDGDGILVPMFNRGILLWQDELIEAVRSAGVDNIDCYECILVDPVSGISHKNYKAVNIIGLVSKADLSMSAYSTPSGIPSIDTDFDSVFFDEHKAHELLLFRMAECVSAIVVHESVKNSIEDSGIPYINFVQPENWFG